MPKGPWYLVLSRTIWHGPNTLMDILENTKCQGSFAMNQISIGTFGQVQLACKNYSRHLFSKIKCWPVKGMESPPKGNRSHIPGACNRSKKGEEWIWGDGKICSSPPTEKLFHLTQCTPDQLSAESPIFSNFNQSFLLLAQTVTRNSSSKYCFPWNSHKW